MNILYGLYTPDEGEILLHGKPIELGSTKAAIEHGIGMVHQHFMLIPVMTVAENIVLATEPRRAGLLLDYDAAAQARARALGALRPARRPERARRPDHASASSSASRSSRRSIAAPRS